MPASRWVSHIKDMLEWIKEEDSEIGDWLLEYSGMNQLAFLGESNNQNQSENDLSIKIPEVLPILPLRGIVVYPQTTVPLTIGQQRSISLVDDVATSSERMIGLIASKNPDLELPNPDDLYTVGTVAIVHRLFRAPDGTVRLLVQGLARFRTLEFVSTEPYLKAMIKAIPEVQESGIEIEALARNVRDQFSHIADMIPSIPRELVSSIASIEDPLQTVYMISNFQRMDIADAQSILEFDSATEKLRKLVGILTRESEVLELSQKIQNEARSEIEKVQRDFFLREQLKAIQRELGEKDEQARDIEELREKIDFARMSDEANKQANHELERLARLPTIAAEYGVIRTYIDWLVSLPWSIGTEDNLDIAHARQVLDQDHYGLEDVKERILEFLAVRKLRLERRQELTYQPSQDMIRKEREGVILCLIGPPGVGKTSLGQSIARAMGRKFIRISLGGIRDEAEIRGHRRTYIGALPGRIIQTLRRVESKNPVFMLDEIDKLGQDFRGDPASALLEVLDPEQNVEFRDHYLEVAYNLSEVMFITTANWLETIPAPLLDRMEVITISGYTAGEKCAIARGYLIPRQLRENGLRPDEAEFTDEALNMIIRMYTREAGVRNLEREIGSVCRKIVTQIAEGKEGPKKITPDTIRELLGKPKFMGIDEIARRTSVPGVATGLAWTPTGGETLFIEASRMPGGKGFQLTGSLGKVMQESAQAALSYVRSQAEKIGLDPNFFEKSDIHLHIPSGAQPKDGPSAGVTMVTALVSLISGRLVNPYIGMTGEITLSGQVLPIGGVKEKVLAAHRSGLTVVILPKLNEPDLEDIPEDVRNLIKFVFVETLDEVLQYAFESPSVGSSTTPILSEEKDKEIAYEPKSTTC